MEQLHVMHLGSVGIEVIDPSDSLEQDYNLGLYWKTQAFLKGYDQLFCSLRKQVENFRVNSKMAGYL
jgi:hypothetical protein